jgi:hypothetical protein
MQVPGGPFQARVKDEMSIFYQIMHVFTKKNYRGPN